MSTKNNKKAKALNQKDRNRKRIDVKMAVYIFMLLIFVAQFLFSLIMFKV